MKAVNIYSIRAISNLHVGSGEGDFSIVDKQVQRDPVTGLPTIHASGIKGALREAMEYAEKHETEENKRPIAKSIEEIFGAAVKPEKGKERIIKQGLNNFFDGKLIALPIRSSHHFFYVATCPSLLETLIADLKTFSDGHAKIKPLETLAAVQVEEGAPKHFGNGTGQVMLEDWGASYKDTPVADLTAYFGDRIALLHDDDFATLAKELPIIARNYLVNGISSNLWYEEVVPREARFYTMISRHADKDDLNDFLITSKNLIQLGANATVGYGLCEFKTM